jgi:hypothetical protein
LDYSDSSEVRLVASFYNQPDEDLMIGMDGVYRMVPIGEHGLPMGLRAPGLVPQTFLFECD